MDSIVITNPQYFADPMTGENTCIVCQINGRHTSVPLDPDNTDYQAIQKWITAGNTIQDAD